MCSCRIFYVVNLDNVSCGIRCGTSCHTVGKSTFGAVIRIANKLICGIGCNSYRSRVTNPAGLSNRGVSCVRSGLCFGVVKSITKVVFNLGAYRVCSRRIFYPASVKRFIACFSGADAGHLLCIGVVSVPAFKGITGSCSRCKAGNAHTDGVSGRVAGSIGTAGQFIVNVILLYFFPLRRKFDMTVQCHGCTNIYILCGAVCVTQCHSVAAFSSRKIILRLPAQEFVSLISDNNNIVHVNRTSSVLQCKNRVGRDSICTLLICVFCGCCIEPVVSGNVNRQSCCPR